MMFYQHKNMPSELSLLVSFVLPMLSSSNFLSAGHPGQIDARSTANALIYADSILAAASGGGAWFTSPDSPF